MHPARLYTLGPAGTFSDQAAQRLRAHLAAGGQPPPVVEYTQTIPEVLERTEADPASYGVFPIESSDVGTVLFAQDSLVKHRVTLEWELTVRVRFALLAAVPLGNITRVLSQPVAYEQCRDYLAKHLPAAKVSFTTSNIESGRQFLEGVAANKSANTMEPVAAVVPLDYGQAHPAVLAAEDIQTLEYNTTRFLAARAAPEEAAHDFTRYKTSILIEPEGDRPGLLYDLLSVFKRHDINLCRLESRPARVRPWTYVFFLDFNNNAHTEQALAELAHGERKITVLGSYNRIES